MSGTNDKIGWGAVALATLTLGFGAQADEPALQALLKKRLPPDTQMSVRPTPVKALYEVTLDGRVVYMSADGRYVFNGILRDLKTGENLTEKTQRKARLKLLKAVPADKMITYPAKGERKREMWVFDDIHCPYCRKLHRILPKLQAAGVAVHVLFYPRSGLNGKSYRDAVHVWCQPDRRQALDRAMRGESITSGEEKKACRHPVAEHFALADKVGVSGTPYMVLDNGEAIPGYVPPDKLIPYLLGSASK